jgi:hypothetical protein
MKESKNPKFYSLILILAILIGTFSLYPAFSSLTNPVIIRNSGTITTIPPLHVEGRYIKNSLNQTIILRGVNKVEFADDPDGIWMGSTMWTDENVKAELNVMKSWGVNVIRCHMSVELWKYNIGPNSGHPASPYCSIPAREAIKRFLNFTAERGIYVILDGYSVRSYWTGGDQDGLPFPPYQTSPNASEVIASVDEFVDWWTSMANELKGYPNVIFELWNEPHANRTAWFVAVPQVTNAIRATGATNLIVVQYGYGCYVNLDYPPPIGDADTMDWVWKANLTDPLGNIIYSTHIYRSLGAFHHNSVSGGYWLAWEYNEIAAAFNYMMFDEVLQEYPLLIGEIGADMAFTGEELEHELIAWNNSLTLFEQMGIHYTAFWWRESGVYRLHNGPSNFIPNEAGQILKSQLTGQ